MVRSVMSYLCMPEYNGKNASDGNRSISPGNGSHGTRNVMACGPTIWVRTRDNQDKNP